MARFGALLEDEESSAHSHRRTGQAKQPEKKKSETGANKKHPPGSDAQGGSDGWKKDCGTQGVATDRGVSTKRGETRSSGTVGGVAD